METERLRCLNLDWLEVYVLENPLEMPVDASYFRQHGYVVSERDYGTRVYAQMFTIDDKHGQPWLEIRRHPLSLKQRDGGLFPPNACHIRLTNYACYSQDAIRDLRDFLALHQYEFVKIYRIDLALDFELFDYGDDPAKFIARFMSGKYSKVNQTNISAHGQDQWNGRVWNSLSWGKPSSMVSTKMYCKSLELEQVHDKPYIRFAWWSNHLIDEPIRCTKTKPDGTIYKPLIWRVEFSIKSSAKRWFLIEDGHSQHKKIPIPYTLDTFDTHERRLIIFASLARHYFHFKKYETDKRKDRCADKQLFDFKLSDQYVKIERAATADRKPDEYKRLRTLLCMLRLFTSDTTVLRCIETLLVYIDKVKVDRMTLHDTTSPYVQALRILMQERAAGLKSESVTQRLNELIDLLSDDVPVF